MTRIRVKTVVWDSFNVVHIQKHNVTQREVVEVVKNPAYHKHTHSGRYLLVARTGKRIISVVIRRQKLKTYYIITARDAEKKERRRLYEKENKIKNSKF